MSPADQALLARAAAKINNLEWHVWWNNRHLWREVEARPLFSDISEVFDNKMPLEHYSFMLYYSHDGSFIRINELRVEGNRRFLRKALGETPQ